MFWVHIDRPTTCQDLPHELPTGPSYLRHLWGTTDNNNSFKRTRQVDEPKRGVLPTSTHLWLLTVRHSNTWWTVVPMKAAAVAETSTTTMYIKVVIWWTYQLIKLHFNLWVYLKTTTRLISKTKQDLTISPSAPTTMQANDHPLHVSVQTSKGTKLWCLATSCVAKAELVFLHCTSYSIIMGVKVLEGR